MRVLLPATLALAVVPPGYSAYLGAYGAIAISLLALLLLGVRERAIFRLPSSIAILAAIGLLVLSVPFVYRDPRDLLTPFLVLPVLCALGMAVLEAPAGWVPSARAFASICLVGAAVAFVSGMFEILVLGVHRPGLGNNPIHYGSLAALTGSMALIGVVAGGSAWRYLFLLGPVLGMGSAVISGSRGPMLGALVMNAAAFPLLVRWFWHEKAFRLATIACVVAVGLILIVLVGTGDQRALSIFESGMNILRFTGGPDDTRAALYASAVHDFLRSPLYGHGQGQLMVTVRTMFPQFAEVHLLDNLHADWANFAVLAGSMGLLAYLLLLAAPALLLLDRSGRRDRPIVLGALLLTSGQLALGLSNTTFGILPQTVIYAVMLGYLTARLRWLQRHCAL